MKKIHAIATGAAVIAASALSVGAPVSDHYDVVVEQDVTMTAAVDTLFAGEQALMNGIFGIVSFLGGVTGETTDSGFDVIKGDSSGVFDLLVYGFGNPATDPGSYSIFNGSLTPLFDAVNIAVNGGLPGAGDDWFFGGTTVQEIVTHAAGDQTQAITGLLQLAGADLLGMFVPQSIGDLFGGLAGGTEAIDPGLLFDGGIF